MRQPFGQNFLVDQNIARGIVDAAALSPTDTVLEIGPGKWILTGLIAPRVSRLIAVELDRNFIPGLQKKFSASGNVEIVNQDFLSYRLPSSVSRLIIISNLPYSAATPIIEKFFLLKEWSSAVIMTQKEVGERIAAGPGTKQYGYFSVFCQYYAKIQFLFKVLPGSFKPSPKVESAVLKLENKHSLPPPEGFLDVVKAAFGQRRKMILNSLASNLKLPKEQVLEALNACRIDPALRPEKLTEKHYLDLTKHIKNCIIH